MGNEGVGKDRRIQEEELERILKGYLSRFGTTCIFESTSNDDLKYVWGEKSDMPPELYPLLVELAEKEIVDLMKIHFKDEPDQDDIDECETPEEVEQLIKDHETMKSMSPREFWMLFNGPRNKD